MASARCLGGTRLAQKLEMMLGGQQIPAKCGEHFHVVHSPTLGPNSFQLFGIHDRLCACEMCTTPSSGSQVRILPGSPIYQGFAVAGPAERAPLATSTAQARLHQQGIGRVPETDHVVMEARKRQQDTVEAAAG